MFSQSLRSRSWSPTSLRAGTSARLPTMPSRTSWSLNRICSSSSPWVKVLILLNQSTRRWRPLGQNLGVNLGVYRRKLNRPTSPHGLQYFLEIRADARECERSNDIELACRLSGSVTLMCCRAKDYHFGRLSCGAPLLLNLGSGCKVTSILAAGGANCALRVLSWGVAGFAFSFFAVCRFRVQACSLHEHGFQA